MDDFLWAGGQGNMPEVNLTLDFYIQSLTFNLTEYWQWSYFYYHNYSLSECPSDKIVINFVHWKS